MTDLAAATASFPVVFFDGERETDIGTVAVHASLGFRKFQTLISQKIGIAPNQITTSLVRRKKARTSPGIRRKVPIDEFSDFSTIARERDCFVLAVLRRSKRERRGGRARRDGYSGVAGGGEPDRGGVSGTPEKTILKRIPGVDPKLGGGGLIPEAAAQAALWDFESEMRYLQRQREMYLMSTAACYPYPTTACDGYLDDVRRTAAFVLGGPRTAAAAEPPAVCEECLGAREEGRTPPFHWCVYDAVTEGFRSPVGPIQRPPKKHVEASAESDG